MQNIIVNISTLSLNKFQDLSWAIPMEIAKAI